MGERGRAQADSLRTCPRRGKRFWNMSTLERLELSDIEDLVPDLMTSCGLASYDAIHVATAIASGTRAVVTLDAGFAAVPAGELTLYVDPGRIAACRNRRARPR